MLIANNQSRRRIAALFAAASLLAVGGAIVWRHFHPAHLPDAVFWSGDQRLGARLTCPAPGERFVLVLTNLSTDPLLIMPHSYEIRLFDKDGVCLTNDTMIHEEPLGLRPKDSDYWKLQPGERYDLRLILPNLDRPIPENAASAECIASSKRQNWAGSAVVKSFNCPLVTPRVINRLQRSESEPSVWR